MVTGGHTSEHLGKQSGVVPFPLCECGRGSGEELPRCAASALKGTWGKKDEFALQEILNNSKYMVP